MVSGQPVALLFASSSFADPLFISVLSRPPPTASGFSFYWLGHDHPPRQPFVLVILYFSAHRLRQGVRWPRPPPLRPTPLRIYLRRSHSDSYLRFRRKTRRFRRSRRLYLCYRLRSYPTFQTWGTDSPLVWLPPSRPFQVRRTQTTAATAITTATTTRTTRTRTISARYGCGHKCIAVSVPYPPPFLHS